MARYYGPIDDRPRKASHLREGRARSSVRRSPPSVFRVVDDGDSLFVQQREIESVRKNGDIVLSRSFAGMFGVRFRGSALGLHFFSSHLEALSGFAKKQQGDIESMRRRIQRAQESIAWSQAEILQVTK